MRISSFIAGGALSLALPCLALAQAVGGASVSTGSIGGVGASISGGAGAATTGVGAPGSLGATTSGQTGVGASISGQPAGSTVTPPATLMGPPAVTTAGSAATNASATAAAADNGLTVGSMVSGNAGARLGTISAVNGDTVTLRTLAGVTHTVPAGALKTQGGGVTSSYTATQIDALPTGQ